MKIVQVELNPNGFAFICSLCDKTIGAHNSDMRARHTGEEINQTRYADLDGEPFNAYICKSCHDNNLPEEFKVK